MMYTITSVYSFLIVGKLSKKMKLLFFTYKLIRLRRLCTLFKATYTWSEYGKNEYINEFVIEA